MSTRIKCKTCPNKIGISGYNPDGAKYKAAKNGWTYGGRMLGWKCPECQKGVS